MFLTFRFFASKQLLFLPICFTVCAIIAKNIGLSDFEINYKGDVPGEATVQSILKVAAHNFMKRRSRDGLAAKGLFHDEPPNVDAQNSGTEALSLCHEQ